MSDFILLTDSDDPAVTAAVGQLESWSVQRVDASKQIVVMKRSMNPGFAGIDNPLFVDPKTVMLFGDAKDSITRLTAAVKTL